MSVVFKFFVSLVVFAGITGNALAQSNSSLPQQLQLVAREIITGQINAFKSRDHDQAFGYASQNLQKLFGSPDRFIGMVKSGYGAIYGAQIWSYGRSIMKDGALHQEVILTGPSGWNWVALYTLKKQTDGKWRITTVKIRKANALST